VVAGTVMRTQIAKKMLLVQLMMMKMMAITYDVIE